MRPEQSYHLDQKLHTEVLEEKYGKITLLVLHDDDDTREVLLADQQNIARTYALTIRSSGWRRRKEIVAVNEAIRAGEPIGQAFKSRGYIISKNVLAVYTMRLPEWLRQAFMVDDYFGKIRITEFIVKAQQSDIRYGYVAELYSPDFRRPVVNTYDRAQVNTTISSRRVAGLKNRICGTINQGIFL